MYNKIINDENDFADDNVYIDNRKHSSIKMLIHISYHVAIIAFGLIALFMSIIGYSHLSGHYDSIIDFKDNWLLNPLVDIQTSATSCPSGYENLVTRIWPGTVQGCDCSFSRNPDFRGILYASICDQNKTDSGCFHVSSTAQIPLESFYSNRICGQRAGDSFVNAVRPTQNGTGLNCPNEHKLWGKGDINTALCVKNSEKWPINGFYISDQSNPIEPGYTSVPLDNGIQISFTTDSVDLPIVRFKFSEGHICANPYTYEITPGRTLYILLRNSGGNSCSQKIGDSYYDPRYNEVYSVIERRLFEDNGVMRVIEHLPRYPIWDSNNYSWNLYSNNYNSWKTSCEHEKDLSRSTMMVMIEHSIHVANYQLRLMAICIAQLIICILLRIAVLYLFVKNINNSNTICLKWASFFIEVGFEIAKIYFFSICLSIGNDYKESIAKIKDANCSGEYANKVFSNYSTALLSSHGQNKSGLIVAILSLSVIVVFTLFEIFPTIKRRFWK